MCTSPGGLSNNNSPTGGTTVRPDEYAMNPSLINGKTSIFCSARLISASA